VQRNLIENKVVRVEHLNQADLVLRRQISPHLSDNEVRLHQITEKARHLTV
jgi:hypothetical protein